MLLCEAWPGCETLQVAAAAAASSQQSFIDEYFSGEYETVYPYAAH